ncbi:2OG-Fe(II) oxygenase [Mesohalobacter halotolerans]|uniref:2OG-Fe(II) oxygenase n=1 Tax=Mesohalobacter halotolerans TaxID=1883405 RepID=UPI001FE68281|nr:2OG-Fe(II) oxygenase [Mesohalobacter halotolerans]
MIVNFFEADHLENLHCQIQSLYDNDALKKAAIGKHFDEHIKTEIRGDYIQWINESSDITVVQQFFQVINHFVDYLNRTCFMGILHKEFHYAVYPKGRFYKRHLDTFDNDQRRKLSMVLYLNKIWTPKNGGDLVVYTQDYPQERAISVVPKFGRLVIFESSVLEHEVKPVVEGVRLSITGWLKVR